MSLGENSLVAAYQGRGQFEKLTIRNEGGDNDDDDDDDSGGSSGDGGGDDDDDDLISY